MHLMLIQSKKLSDIISGEIMSPQRSSGLGTSSFRLPSLIQKNVSPSSLQNMGEHLYPRLTSSLQLAFFLL
jgi:hypothetical protein